MSRIRTIKPEFWSSEKVMECSTLARLLFIGLWNFCDDGGNHPLRLKTIKAEIFPGDEITSETIQGLLDELSSNSLITFYCNGNSELLHVNGWDHQKIDRPTFKYPAFDDECIQHTRRVIVEPSPPEGSLREGKGKERKEQKSTREPNAEKVETTSRTKRSELSLADWIATLRDDEDAIESDDPLFPWSDQVGLPRDFVTIAWFEFKRQFIANGKRQKDWRAHFRNAVRRDWLKLWRFNGETGEVYLTTAGKQAERAMGT
jgi:hypothetical protein